LRVDGDAAFRTRQAANSAAKDNPNILAWDSVSMFFLIKAPVREIADHGQTQFNDLECRDLLHSGRARPLRGCSALHLGLPVRFLEEAEESQSRAAARCL
jgi:hypothetical protein